MRPVELLVFWNCLSCSFQTRSRFHKFQYCSIFKVLCRPFLAGSLFIISHSVPFVKNFFEDFFEAARPFGRRCLKRHCLIKTAYLFYLIQILLSRTFFEVFRCAFGGLPKGFHRVTEPPAIRSKSRYLRFIAFFQGLSFATA